ncbi:MAG: hypothetical protein AB1714_01405 [Acidobacteriota bacterium]
MKNNTYWMPAQDVRTGRADDFLVLVPEMVSPTQADEQVTLNQG